MLKVTKELRAFLVEHHKLDEKADEAAVRKMVGELIVAGSLDAAKVAELTAARESEAELKVRSIVADAVGPLAEGLKALTAHLGISAAGTDGAAAPAGAKATSLASSEPSAPAADPVKAYAAAGAAGGGSQAGGDEEARIRVKQAVEQYDDTRTAATWAKSANPRNARLLGDRPIGSHCEMLPYDLHMPTARSKAISGAWFRHMLRKAFMDSGRPIPGSLKMHEHDRQLLQYIVHECKFVGSVDLPQGGYFDFEGRKAVDDLHRKALLDDSTSGGLEAVPIEFDAAVILTPLLNGEVFPLVSITDVSRRRIEATEIGNPTIGWGVSEGTAINLFDTDGFVSAFDNNIHPVTGAMELGRDFLADSPLDVGAIVLQRYGQVFLKEMDDVLVSGDGSTQPEGVFNASGVSTVSAANGAGGPPTVGDYEALRFGVAKEYRQEAGARATYIGTDTSYSRARGIAVNSSADQRRIFGVYDQESYTLFDRRYAVNGSILNSQVGYVCWNRYRLYRRQGLEVRIVRDDRESVRKNTELIVVRARYGGALEQAAAMVKSINMQQ